MMQAEGEITSLCNMPGMPWRNPWDFFLQFLLARAFDNPWLAWTPTDIRGINYKQKRMCPRAEELGSIVPKLAQQSCLHVPE